MLFLGSIGQEINSGVYITILPDAVLRPAHDVSTGWNTLAVHFINERTLGEGVETAL